jgi:hypothetical protein
VSHFPPLHCLLLFHGLNISSPQKNSLSSLQLVVSCLRSCAPAQPGTLGLLFWGGVQVPQPWIWALWSCPWGIFHQCNLRGFVTWKLCSQLKSPGFLTQASFSQAYLFYSRTQFWTHVHTFKWSLLTFLLCIYSFALVTKILTDFPLVY